MNLKTDCLDKWFSDVGCQSMSKLLFYLLIYSVILRFEFYLIAKRC